MSSIGAEMACEVGDMRLAQARGLLQGRLVSCLLGQCVPPQLGGRHAVRTQCDTNSIKVLPTMLASSVYRYEGGAHGAMMEAVTALMT